MIDGATAPGVVASPGRGSGTLSAYASSGLQALISIVPGLVWSGFVGALRGFFFLGFAAASITAALQVGCAWLELELPLWLWVAHWLLWPLSFALAGGYIGGTRGLLARLTREVVERNLMVYLYAFVRPTLARLARNVEGGAGRLTPAGLRHELHTSVRASLDKLAERTQAASWVERVQGWVGFRVQLMLTLAALPVMTSSEREDVVADLESISLERVEEALADSIAGLFEMQVLVAGVLAVLVSGTPLLVYALLN